MVHVTSVAAGLPEAREVFPASSGSSCTFDVPRQVAGGVPLSTHCTRSVNAAIISAVSNVQ